jgi:tetratricopeptide (TPR) repeat protein
MAVELANIRHAWSLSFGETADANMIGAARAMFEFFELQVFHADAHEFFTKALQWRQADALPLVRVPEAFDVALQARAGATLLFTGRLQEARMQLLAAGKTARQLGLNEEDQLCIRYAALVEACLGNATMADEYARAAIMLARKSGDPHMLVLALRDAAWVAARGPAPKRAVELLKEALAVDSPSVGKRTAWSALLQIVHELALSGAGDFARAALRELVEQQTAGPDVQARAERLLAVLDAEADSAAQ